MQILYLLYNNISWLNYVGRLAFPIFAWQIAVGFEKTRDVKLYVFRLFILAMISQPIFYLLFENYFSQIPINTIFTLLLGLLCLCALKKSKALGTYVTVLICLMVECIAT